MPFITRIPVSNKSTPDIYQITVRSVNIILIADKELTVIDTGYFGTTQEIINSIHQLGRSPEEISLIILTHNHIDHVGGLAELKKVTGARVAIHKNDIGERKNLPSARPEDIDLSLSGGEFFDSMDGLEVIYTPGHTPGCISLFSPENKLIIVGDALRKHRDKLQLPFRVPNSDMEQAKDSINKISQLDFDTICFGHGLPVSGDIRFKLQDLLARNKD